jgi:hypothetical protein
MKVINKEYLSLEGEALDLQLTESLNISKSASEFWSIVDLIFSTEIEKEQLYLDCRGKNRRDIELYVHDKRHVYLDKNKYLSKKEFEFDYYIDKKSSLERLFGQPFSIGMLSMFNGDPGDLYQIHSKFPKSWFMECMLCL